MPKFLFLVLFLVLSLPGFAQEETVQEPLSPNGGQVIIQQRPDSAPAAPAAPTTDAPPTPENDFSEDPDIREIEEARLKNQQKMKGLEAVTKPLAEPALNPLQEIQRLGHKQIDAAALLDDKVLAIIQKVLRTGVLSKLSKEEVRTMIMAKFKGSMWEGFFTKFPKMLNIAVDLMRDKDALAGLVGIMVRKSDLKDYSYIWIVIFLFGLFVKSRIIKPKWPFFKRFRYSLVVSLILSAVSIYLFYSFFSEELGPTLAVIANNF